MALIMYDTDLSDVECEGYRQESESENDLALAVCDGDGKDREDSLAVFVDEHERYRN